MVDIVLASASPRRKELLEDAGVSFRVFAVDADESLGPDLLANPQEAVKKIAERKAHAAVEQLIDADYVGTMAVIASDTMVVLDGRIFGKPADEAEAREMLRQLSGRMHQVHTAVSLWLIHAPEGEDLGLIYRTFVDTANVRFDELDDARIQAYLDTGEPFDKAGAYGIQGAAGEFAHLDSGSLDTVIGLPVKRLLAEYPEVFEGAE